MRSQERQKRYAAQKKAQELLVKQRMLQQQRGGAYGTTGTYGTAGPSGSNFYNPNSFSQSPIIQEIPVQRTPIIKNGKIIGYGIPITDPSQLPSQTLDAGRPTGKTVCPLLCWPIHRHTPCAPRGPLHPDQQ